MNFEEIFWGSSIDEIKRGYVYLKKEGIYICLCCNEVFEEGMIYQKDNAFMDAKKAVEIHLVDKHQSMFHYLLEMDKKYTSLTEHQKQLILKFYNGLSDKDIAKEMSGSTSTVRNQRFSLREKAKQAKIFLSLMELLENKMGQSSEEKFIPIHRSATSIDERYAITESERESYLKTYFKNHKLISFPTKQKRIIIVLQHIISYFEHKRRYSEKEVNDILKEIYHDYVTIRRYLIEYGFLGRRIDGSEYWVK
ncbi:DUF2087 domain-containing protein [Mycoplasmatota bacterium]|nr:DUF2087 domain-containing protein [Mycoplasmatota bacterium]